MPATKKKAPVNAFLQASPKAQLKEALKNKSHKPVVGLAEYNVLDFTVKALKALQDVTKVPLATQAEAVFTDFVAEKHKLAKGAANYKGIEGDAEASLESRKKSTMQVLKQEEKEILEAHGIPYGKIAPTFAFNTERSAQHPDAMRKIGEYIGSLNLPADFIEVLPGKDVVTDDTLEAVAKLNDKETIAKLLPMVTVTAIKPTKVQEGLTLAAALAQVLKSVTKETEVA